MPPFFAGRSWLAWQGKENFLEIFAQHRASLDEGLNPGVRGKALKEAWEKFMQEILEEELIKPGTTLLSVQDYIRENRRTYQRKASRIRGMEVGVAWSQRDLQLIQAFAPLQGMAVGAGTADNDGGGDAGSGVAPWGVQDCQHWLARHHGYFILLRHGQECPGPGGLCQRTCDASDCQKDKLLWNHFSTCPKADCAQIVCVIRRHMLKHYKDCSGERCPMCTQIKQMFPDFRMALAAKVNEQIWPSNLRSPSSTSQPAQGVLAVKQPEQQMAQLQQPTELLLADHRQQELRTGCSGNLTEDERFQAARHFVEQARLLDCKIAAESESQLPMAPVHGVHVPHQMQQSTGDPTEDERFQAARRFVERARLLDIEKLSESESQLPRDKK